MPDPTRPATVVIENFYPCIEGGRYPVKRVVGEPLPVWVDVFKDGHDVISAVLKWRREGAAEWQESVLLPLENDRWHGSCSFPAAGRYEYAVEAWGDVFRSWKKTFAVRVETKDPGGGVEA